MNAPDTEAAALRERCRTLLAEGTVQVVVGYGEVLADGGGDVRPVFVTDPADVGALVLDRRCRQDLVTYLLRPEVAALGRAAVVVKGCDARAVAVLVQESQLVRDDVHVIGVACDDEGVGAPRCRSCPVRTPRGVDEVAGALADGPQGADPGVEPPAAEVPAVEPPEGDRYARVEEFLRLTPAERLAYWRSEFARCTRCHACRQVCPLCYCRVCVVDRSRPQTVPTSAHPVGVLEFHLTRA
ncbi:MAG: formate dehydrogenase, partial [Actinomycetota bacterium]|nr:formate dehydrogenase [Actinomycetota bacterium]